MESFEEERKALVAGTVNESDEALGYALEVFDERMAEARRRYAAAFLQWTAKCESEIERLMGAALWEYFAEVPGIQMEPQRQIGGYRVDFAICVGRRRVVVECDGHAFHEKTKQQAARDKRRDRELARLGWPTVRFTGSEIWNAAQTCARDVVEIVIGPLQAGGRV